MKHSRRPFTVLQCCQCVDVSVSRPGCAKKTSGTPLPGRTDGSPGIRRGSWGTQDGTAGRRSCLNAVFRALYVAEENYEARKRKTHAGLGGNAILRFSSGKLGLYQNTCRMTGVSLDSMRSDRHEPPFAGLVALRGVGDADARPEFASC